MRSVARDQPDEDAERFQAWQVAALTEHPAGTELHSFGPFRAVVPAVNQPGGWVTIVDGTTTEEETKEAVANLRAVFNERQTALEVEYNEALFPQVGSWLEAAGFTFAERNPLMACRPDRFKPFAAPEVTLRLLSAASHTEDLWAFQTIRWTDGGDEDRVVPPIEQLRKDLASVTSCYLLAWLNGEPAGTGISHALRGGAEIVGVVTSADKRRRGVAATVTSDLVARHFASGGDFVFLDAADDAAARVYERLGFKRFGANLVYR